MEETQNNQATAPELADLAEDSPNGWQAIELPKIVLASASPRRAEILRTVNWPFEILPMDIDETRAAGEDAATYVQRVAWNKAQAAARARPGSMIVAADTIVLIGEQIMGKP